MRLLVVEDEPDLLSGLLRALRKQGYSVDTATDGVDVVLSYDHELFGGALGLDVSFSYAHTDITRYAPTPSELTSIDSSFLLVGSEETNTLETAAPNSKLIFTADWSGEHVSLLGRVSRYGAATRVFSFDPDAHQKYGPEVQLDFEGEYRINQHVAITLGAANVLDNYPERSFYLINFFENLPYDILSPIGVNGRYVYTRLSVSF